jgi:hypothetical protein
MNFGVRLKPYVGDLDSSISGEICNVDEKVLLRIIQKESSVNQYANSASVKKRFDQIATEKFEDLPKYFQDLHSLAAA